VIDGQWTLGSLLAFQAYLGYVFGPAQYLASANLELQNARASLERVSALFDIVPEEKIGVGKTVDRLKGEIEFKNVSFSYDDREPVLEDVSFRIHAGERVAIVGPSGVGKTTLMSLILRFYRPASGEIYFDGSPATDYEVGSLRRRIGYVSQSTLLLSGTIMENLRYGNPEASEEKLKSEKRESTSRKEKNSGSPLQGRWLKIQTSWCWMSQPPHWTARRKSRSSACFPLSSGTRLCSWQHTDSLLSRTQTPFYC
jgi:ABC-type multidrug transport system fused ATPase/permease subunit